jgi:glycerol-3-phosphate cytidylyltransferase-like family protein
MPSLSLLLVLATASQAPAAQSKANSSPSLRPASAIASEKVVIRNPDRSGVLFFKKPEFMLEVERVMASKDEEKIKTFIEEHKEAGDWKPVASFTPAVLLKEKAVRGAKSFTLCNVEITDGPAKGERGWIDKYMTVRAENGMSIERKLDLERTVANKKAKEAKDALARAKKKAGQIKNEQERLAYLEKMKPVWEAQARANAQMAAQAMSMQAQAANAAALQQATQAMQQEAASVQFRAALGRSY